MSIQILHERIVVQTGPKEAYEHLVVGLKDLAGYLAHHPDFRVVHGQGRVDLGIVVLPSVAGERVIVRVYDPVGLRIDLDAVGITQIEAWRWAIREPSGLCLICGPTGSGKTTTRNASLRELERLGRSVRVVGARPAADPASPEVGPDVIAFGDIRRADTAGAVVAAAENGRMVFGTVFGVSVPDALARIQSAGIAAGTLRRILRSVLVQDLVSVTCEACEDGISSSGEPCRACDGTGFSGRKVVSECATFADAQAVDQALAILQAG